MYHQLVYDLEHSARPSGAILLEEALRDRGVDIKHDILTPEEVETLGPKSITHDRDREVRSEKSSRACDRPENVEKLQDIQETGDLAPRDFSNDGYHDGLETENDPLDEDLPADARSHPGTCRPCAFFTRPDGCYKGDECARCHHPEHAEFRLRYRKRRQAERLARYLQSGRGVRQQHPSRSQNMSPPKTTQNMPPPRMIQNMLSRPAAPHYMIHHVFIDQDVTISRLSF